VDSPRGITEYWLTKRLEPTVTAFGFRRLVIAGVIFPPRKFLHYLITVATMYYNKIHWRQDMSKAISIRIPEDLASKLSEIAKETERTKSFHVQKALEAYLVELADLQIALDRLHDPSDPIVSIDEMRKELEL
jgi:RHH-type rel operon transcriptional repressor/antitoxin RelB